MLVRLVKMKFKPEKVADFLENFNASQQHIKDFEGCLFLELLASEEENGVFFTHSHWVNDEALQRYRNSSLFKGIWSKTKPMFEQKAKAWSTYKYNPLNSSD